MHKNTRLQQTTIVFGYALFALVLIALILWTIIPFSKLFATTTKPENVAYLLISLVIGTFVPVFLSYVFGDKSTHVKNKSSHYFNGVLFGIAAYWVYGLFMNVYYVQQVFSRGQDNVLVTQLINLIPVAATLVVTAFIAVSYARHQKKKQTVLEHRPYGIVLSFTFIASLLSSALYIQRDAAVLLSFLAVGIGVPSLMAAISYVVLGPLQLKRFPRATMAVVAVTIPYVSATLVSQFVAALFQFGGAEGLVGLVVGICAWIAFLLLVRRKK